MALSFESRRISLEGHRKICLGAFRALGMSEKSAAETADNLLFADLRGTNSHGLARLKMYTTQLEKGFINAKAEPEIVSERGGALVIDGRNAPGVHTAIFAMEKTVEKAKAGGMAFCTVRNSSHYGVAGYYSAMASAVGQIGFAFTNTLPVVAHFGAKKPGTGTNPLSVAMPCETHDDFLLDMATSVVARGAIANCAREGKPIPLGWACDKDGNPTTDAKAAMAGYCLPLGGGRGSGICLAIDAMCGILSGGCSCLETRPMATLSPEDYAKGPGVCHAFGAIEVDYFMDLAEFKARMDRFIDGLKAAPTAPGFDEILMPGEPEARRCAANRKAGSVPVALENFNEVREICKRLCPGIDPEDYVVE